MSPLNVPPVPSVTSSRSCDWNPIFGGRILGEAAARKVGVKVEVAAAPRYTSQQGGGFEVGVHLVVEIGTGLHVGCDGDDDDDARGTWVEGFAWPVQWRGWNVVAAESVAAAEFVAESVVVEAVVAAEQAVVEVVVVAVAAAAEVVVGEVVAAESVVAVKDGAGRWTESVGAVEVGGVDGSGGIEEHSGWVGPGV